MNLVNERQFTIDDINGKRRIFAIGDLMELTPEFLARKIGFRDNSDRDSKTVIWYINGKPLHAWLETQYHSRHHNHTVHITWHIRQQGGFIVDVIKLVFSLFKFFLLIPKILIWFGSLIIWLIKAIIFLLVNLGEVLAKDGLLSFITYISQTLIMLPLRFIGSMFKKGANKVGAVTIGAVWGADNVVNDEDDPSDVMDGPCDGRKCYAAEDGTVPFSVIVATILFPPLGVFMEYGLTSWLQLIICTLLTLMFYFPGLIYALVMLFC
jgi:uncharacterized membrane protein YqaE (UPF0057 family)